MESLAVMDKAMKAATEASDVANLSAEVLNELGHLIHVIKRETGTLVAVDKEKRHLLEGIDSLLSVACFLIEERFSVIEKMSERVDGLRQELAALRAAG